MERLPPKSSTVRALFAKSGNECSFPGCGQALVDDRNLLVGEVCHINAVKNTEARYDATKTEEELRDYDNLILLCHAHHVRVDSLADEYPAPVLRTMRENHERTVEHKVYTVSDDIVNDALFQLLKLEWEPYFEPTIEYLIADIMEGRGGQQGMNRLAGQVGVLLDATLYILTLRALASAALQERHRLLREHQEWQEHRHREAHKASLEMAGGTMAPLLYGGTYNDITEQRIEYLRNTYSLKAEHH
jgi:hypothetical protein